MCCGSEAQQIFLTIGSFDGPELTLRVDKLMVNEAPRVPQQP